MGSMSHLHRCASKSTRQQTAMASGRCFHQAAMLFPQPSIAKRCMVVARGKLQNIETALLGNDFGARDATAAEVASNFSDKVLGNYNTEHIIKPPDAIKNILGLASRTCKGNQCLTALSAEEQEQLRQQVPGWRVGSTSTGLSCIRQDWKFKDEASAQTFVSMLRKLAECEEHSPAFQMVVSASVAVELSTSSAGGLTENDFILATKINDLQVAELLAKRKPKFWA